jgi:signal transduction histidine kinase
MQASSLAFRITAFSGAWILVTLVLTATMLVYFYEQHSARHYDEHVTMHMEELLDASRAEPDGSFWLAYLPSDPRYDDLYSGWYWAVLQGNAILLRSPSLGGDELEVGELRPGLERNIFETRGPAGTRLRVHAVEHVYGPSGESVVFLASAPMTGVFSDVADFSDHIVMSFLVLGIGLLLAVLLQVRVALQPLKAIGKGIGDIREGRASKLRDTHLVDVQPLVDELNNLVEHNAILLKRARNQLGDLAHSVKNPLTVIKNEARNLDPAQRDLIIEQTSDISRNVDHYLTRARTFGTEKVLGARSEVAPIVEDLVYAMRRLYKERGLEIESACVQPCWFRGEGQDLEEMLGNLLDNACKWADSRVSVHCRAGDDLFVLAVEDDGPGIPEEEMASVMRRGHKLDESKPGHGQGLGIIKDIAELYGGSLKLMHSRYGGLLAELALPAA